MKKIVLADREVELDYIIQLPSHCFKCNPIFQKLTPAAPQLNINVSSKNSTKLETTLFLKFLLEYS